MSTVDTIVVICPLLLWRDCVSRVLAAEFPAIPILAFSELHEWRSVSEWHGHSPLLLISEGGEGVDLKNIAKLIQRNPSIKIAIFSRNNNMHGILEAMSVGVQAYLPNYLKLEIVMKAIHLVMVGGSFFPVASFFEKKAGGGTISVDPLTNDNYRISRRELDIIAGVSCGKSNASIARDLNLKESTIKVHVRSIMRKIGVNTRTAIAYKSEDIFRFSMINGVYSKTMVQS